MCLSVHWKSIICYAMIRIKDIMFKIMFKRNVKGCIVFKCLSVYSRLFPKTIIKIILKIISRLCLRDCKEWIIGDLLKSVLMVIIKKKDQDILL